MDFEQYMTTKPSPTRHGAVLSTASLRLLYLYLPSNVEERLKVSPPPRLRDQSDENGERYQPGVVSFLSEALPTVTLDYQTVSSRINSLLAQFTLPRPSFAPVGGETTNAGEVWFLPDTEKKAVAIIAAAHRSASRYLAYVDFSKEHFYPITVRDGLLEVRTDRAPTQLVDRLTGGKKLKSVIQCFVCSRQFIWYVPGEDPDKVTEELEDLGQLSNVIYSYNMHVGPNSGEEWERRMTKNNRPTTLHRNLNMVIGVDLDFKNKDEEWGIRGELPKILVPVKTALQSAPPSPLPLPPPPPQQTETPKPVNTPPKQSPPLPGFSPLRGPLVSPPLTPQWLGDISAAVEEGLFCDGATAESIFLTEEEKKLPSQLQGS